ncbi:MAG: MEMO1 family protein [Candidatus Diapherotrites archaeon]|nr:MEMO1 family protein [Candidatus Diapherotrites archaeon]
MVREPAVAGQFYPKERTELNNMLSAFFSGLKPKVRGISGVSPHAGYIYSGKTAAFTHSAIEDADTYVILGPDHTGAAMGGNIAYPRGSWETPLGSVDIDEEAVAALGDVVGISERVHTFEHSIEVQVPFLQYAHPNKDFKIVPIIMGDQSLEAAQMLGEALSSLNCAVIASSDFSHYVPRAVAEENDHYVIKSILELDEEEFYERVLKRNVSVCGPGPIAASMIFAKHKQCIEGVLLNYSTSGDVTGDDLVVGYSSIVFV